MKKVKKPTVNPSRTRGHDGKLYRNWLVIWYEDGERKRKQFSEKSAGNAFAEVKYTELLNVGRSRRHLSTVLTESTLRDCERLVEQLGGRYQVLEVAEFFLLHHADPNQKITLSDAITKFLGYQETRISEASYREFRNTLRNFTNFAGDKFVHEVTLETVEGFLTSLRAKGGVEAAAPKTWENNRKSLSRFFGWCVERPQTFIAINPAEHATRKEDKALNEIHSLTAQKSEQLMRYLEAKYPQLIPYFSIALFAGVRPNGEMERLSKKTNAIRLENQIINLMPDVTKTGEARHVIIQPNLSAWLQRYGAQLFPENSKRDISLVRKEFGLNEKKYHDVLRHSFISAHCQAFGSFVETAIQSGNSEKIIRQRYFNTLTTKTDADRFWAIFPTA